MVCWVFLSATFEILHIKTIAKTSKPRPLPRLGGKQCVSAHNLEKKNIYILCPTTVFKLFY